MEDVNDVALPRVRRGREHLVDLERSEKIYLVIRDHINNHSCCLCNEPGTHWAGESGSMVLSRIGVKRTIILSNQ